MHEQDQLLRVAEKYRKDGYDVLIHPISSDLPPFLANIPVDILARKGDRVVALRVNEEQAADGDPVGMTVDLGIDSARVMIEEAEMLLSPRTMRAAFVMAWASFEAAARTVLKPGQTAFTHATPTQLIEELHSRGLLSEQEPERLQRLLLLRNTVVHGGRPAEMNPEEVLFLLGLARRLLQTEAVPTRLGVSDFATMFVHRAGINQSPKLKELVEKGTQVFLDLLGPSRGNVSIEWDLAEDARGRPVLVLKVSELRGTAAATFDPSELEDTTHLRERLNHLWGDLLEIRSHNQVQQLNRLAGVLPATGSAT